MEVAIGAKVSGDFACFSQPAFKAERVSYPVMTPSAARGVLESVLWKPEFRWEIREIRVLKPIRETTIMRNELGSRQGDVPFVVEDDRQQRTSRILKDVAYMVRAAIVLRPWADAPLRKYVEQFVRRLERGQYHHTPYLGTREFAAWVEPAGDEHVPIPIDRDLGTMLFDIAFHEDNAKAEMQFVRHGADGRRVVSGYAQAIFFDARLRAGVLTVPSDLYRRLDTLEGYDA